MWARISEIVSANYLVHISLNKINDILELESNVIYIFAAVRAFVAVDENSDNLNFFLILKHMSQTFIILGAIK